MTFFSGRIDVHLQVIQPILKFLYLISLIKYPQVRHLKEENHLKECHLWLTLKLIRQNNAFHRCYHSDALFGHSYTYLHVHNLTGQFQTIKLYETKMVYHSDDIPLDIGSAAYALCVLKL